jgi:hypothetical protein
MRSNEEDIAKEEDMMIFCPAATSYSRPADRTSHVLQSSYPGSGLQMADLYYSVLFWGGQPALVSHCIRCLVQPLSIQMTSLQFKEKKLIVQGLGRPGTQTW